MEEEINSNLRKVRDLSYGENPHQRAGLYSQEGRHLELELIITRDQNNSPSDLVLPNIAKDKPRNKVFCYKKGRGELSANNVEDITDALSFLRFFSRPSVAVMKHVMPCGFATQNKDESLSEVYRKAREADRRSSYGGVVVSNSFIDLETAKTISESFVDCVAAPEFDESAINVFERKENLRCVKFSNLENKNHYVKSLFGDLILVQEKYFTKIKSYGDFIVNPFVEIGGSMHRVERTPTERELEDLLSAWYVASGVRSNGVVILKDGVSIGIGYSTERVGAVEIAIARAYQKGFARRGKEYNLFECLAKLDELPVNPLEGAVLASDGFFPKADSIELIGEHGIKAIVQPGGSKKDYEIIDAANKLGIAMVFTGERCFRH
ncbi:hypothetical protein HY450_02410 [Candidatus Pacearchaeota archaeon]|nr:hypothetical protein [Candidatus Pacearchaeota archaeon]